MCFRSMKAQILIMKVQLVGMVCIKLWLSQLLHNRANLLMKNYWKDLLAWVCYSLLGFALLFSEKVSQVPTQFILNTLIQYML